MKKIIALLLALVMTFGMSSICVSADNEPYPWNDLLFWEPYRYYKSYYEFELNWVLDYDEDEINFWPPCCIQCRDSSDGRWWTIEVVRGKPGSNSADVPWFPIDGKTYGEYRIYCPVFGYYKSLNKMYDDDYHEEAITSDVIKIRQPFEYSPEIKKTSRSKTAVRLTWWDGSCGDGTRIQQYDAKKKKWVNVLTVRSNADSARVTGLKPGKTYKFRIRQYKRVADKHYPVLKKTDKDGNNYYSNVFWSEPSNVVTVKTKK